MRLAESQKVVDLLGIPTGTGVLGNANVALEVSAPIIAEMLGTTLHAVINTDYFSYHAYAGRRKFEPYQLRLSAGFVDAATVVVRESALSGPLKTASEGDVVATADYVIDAARGLVTMLRDVNQGNSVLSVTYEAGFPGDSEGLLQDTPDWLTRAGTLAAARVSQMAPASIAKGKAGVVRDIQNAVYDAVSSIVNAHKRPRMGLVWPARSESEDG